MPTLQIISGSTRPGRASLPIAHWIQSMATKHGGFDLDLVDLAELNLPLLDEPDHPAKGNYTQPHTQEWSRRVDAADAVVFVTPEYNHSFSAPLKNAIDYLHREWANKPAGLVTYSPGPASGVRAAEALKPTLTVLRMVPVPTEVNIPHVSQFLDDGVLTGANDIMEQAALTMLDGLQDLTTTLQPLRRA